MAKFIDYILRLIFPPRSLKKKRIFQMYDGMGPIRRTSSEYSKRSRGDPLERRRRPWATFFIILGIRHSLHIEGKSAVEL